MGVWGKSRKKNKENWSINWTPFALRMIKQQKGWKKMVQFLT